MTPETKLMQALATVAGRALMAKGMTAAEAATFLAETHLAEVKAIILEEVAQAQADMKATPWMKDVVAMSLNAGVAARVLQLAA